MFENWMLLFTFDCTWPPYSYEIWILKIMLSRLNAQLFMADISFQASLKEHSICSSLEPHVYQSCMKYAKQ